MRKIKPNKKEIEKKTKKLAKLMDDLQKFHFELHEEAKALETVQKIYDMKPDDPIPSEKVASICIDYGRTDAAAKAVDYLEEKFPPTPYRLFLRARVCDLQRDYGGCIKYAEKALEYKDIDLLTKLMCHNILGHAYRYAGDAPMSLEHYELSAKTDTSGVADPGLRAHTGNIKREDYCNYLFSLHNLPFSREKIYEEICGFNDLYINAKQFTHDPATHPKHDKIRIGYISPDIRRHVVAFFSYAFYKCYDKSRFEVYIYAKNKEDNVTKEFIACTDGYRNILFDKPEEAAQKIKDDEIDILVDLSGHTANNCLPVMAHKPAPVQLCGIGWFNTTGLKTIDYFIVDKYIDPVGLNDEFFSEKMLRLQHSHFCYMWHDDPLVVNPAPCTKKGYITFVSFNNFTKVTDETLEVWAKIVNAVPNAKLYLKGKAFRDQYGTDKAIARIEKAGLPKEKLIYEPDEQKYLHKYVNADIALDTFPYPGGGTTCDALYMGLPVITLVGDRHNGRFGYSLLTNAGFPELCAFSIEEYIQKAVDLANDWDRVRDYHLTIRRRFEESPIMDDSIYMGEIESAYEKIWDAWTSGKELPDFPQDPEPITQEQAEEYYNRARNYIHLEKEFKNGKIENNVNVKRALYYLTLAEPVDKKHDAEIYLLKAACKQELNDYVGAYDDIRKAGECIYAPEHKPGDFSRKFLQQFHERLAKLSLMNGYPADAADNYDRAAEFAEDKTDVLKLCSSALLSMHFLDIPGEDLAAAHFEYQNLVNDIKPYTKYHDRKPILKGEQRIKIGYLSPDFRLHAAFPFIFGMISCHNKQEFEVTCYSLNEKDDTLTEAIKNNVEHFENVNGLSYEEIAKKIHSDNIDILVDLAGHSAGSGLPVLAYRPAPIQISGIGYMSTTGMKTVDYFITDEIVDPPGEHEALFSEKLIYMPSQFCYAHRQDVPTPEYAPCTKRNYVVFGTICRYQKMSDDLFRIWKEILEQVPGSVLLMRAQEFASNTTIDQAYERMKKIGFNMDQVLFRPAIPDYMAELTHLDIILDAYPYVGGATTVDALYMGVPVVTFFGERRSTRFGLSILENIGMGDLATNSVREYIDRAVGLAKDIEALDALHKNLRTMVVKSENLDPKHYTKLFEQKLEKIFRVGDSD